ncbi:Putative ERV/ALR sulfhydryl oxidase domain, sulfhydryl oxidase ALR/ERV [Colletotrichum destructivum]|uniref:Sulfhydryl oxidase n=1 Tax=Colletotrichum destructivum TaxID=34406 RepID=A0AAX4IN73_9PEZI|nr:Putative ERV/ALR sulfhydryl oxidase domain, sulfhydryl oxidase ALR/ERV [Colletotrichum destructivum]
MARRQHLSLMVLLAIVAFFSVSYLFSSGSADPSSPAPPVAAAPAKGDSVSSSADTPDLGHISSAILSGESIAPKLENATAKAELGRASWKLFHTMMARFPEKPTPDDSLALKTYIQLFARLYPCGDCASHFRKLLAKYPPQTSSRNAAAGWACFVHNEVNTRLKKDQFDCNKIGDFYDCGCGDEDKKKAEAGEKTSLELEKNDLTKGA